MRQEEGESETNYEGNREAKPRCTADDPMHPTTDDPNLNAATT